MSRAIARWLLPLGLVAVIAAGLAAVALHSFHANRRGAVALTEQVLAGLEARVSAQVDAFLAGPERAVRLARQVYSLAPEGEGRVAFERFGFALLAEMPQVSLVMAGDEAGNYLGMSRRGEGYGALLLRNEPGPRQLERTLYDAALREVGREPVAENNFDPRQRPWYEAAVRSADTAWTEFYVFFTDRVPGLTVAAAVWQPGAERPQGVIAVDISLRALSDFLAGLSLAPGARAVILDGRGRIVAHPDHRAALRELPDGALAPVRVDELDDPVLARAYDRLRLDGASRSLETVGDERYIVVALPLQARGATGWSVLVTAPEASFTGFVDDVNREVLVLYAALSPVVLALLLYPVRSALRADRAARRLREAEAEAAAERATFDRLAGSGALHDPSRALPPEVTEELAALAQAPRASIWRLSADGRALVLEDGWDAERRGHTAGAQLRREEAPAFFAALAAADRAVIDAPDAAAERVTAELHRLWLEPLGARGVLAAPIRHGGRALGVVWAEDAAGSARAAGFLVSVARLLALRLAGGVTRLAERAAAVRQEEASPVPVVAGLQAAQLAATAREALPDNLAADVFAQVAVCALRFLDPAVLATRRAGATQPLAHAAARALEEAAAAAGVSYLRVVGEQAVAACGLTPDGAGAPAARAIASFALAARDRLAALFEAQGLPPAFRMGIDLGLALGSRLGQGEGFLNLWGEAPEAAERMAASAPDGAIQATERAYAALSGTHLFRPRGAFHLPRLGAMNTYVLAAGL